MYQYNDADQTLVNERVAQFRGQTERYLKGEIGEDEFRTLRLMNGLYVQIHALCCALPFPMVYFPLHSFVCWLMFPENMIKVMHISLPVKISSLTGPS